MYTLKKEHRCNRCMLRHLYQSGLPASESHVVVFFVPFAAIHAVDLVRHVGSMFYSESGLSLHNAIAFEFKLKNPTRCSHHRLDNFEFVRAWSLQNTANQDTMWNARHARMVANLLAIAPNVTAVNCVTPAAV